MLIKTLHTLYFSGTDRTKNLVDHLSESVIASYKTHYGRSLERSSLDITKPNNRIEDLNFDKDDMLIIGLPVYAGRVPNILLKFLKRIQGEATKALAIVTFGNRDYDDALIELSTILEENGFLVMGAGAFVGEHSFSTSLAKGRPNQEDLDELSEFATNIVDKIGQKHTGQVKVKGQSPIRDYYKPVDEYGQNVDLRKVKPKTNGQCNHCKLCVNLCPMASISHEKVDQIVGICIKCCACVKKCPQKAKYFDDPQFIRHKEELEADFMAAKANEVFL